GPTCPCPPPPPDPCRRGSARRRARSARRCATGAVPPLRFPSLWCAARLRSTGCSGSCRQDRLTEKRGIIAETACRLRDEKERLRELAGALRMVKVLKSWVTRSSLTCSRSSRRPMRGADVLRLLQ